MNHHEPVCDGCGRYDANCDCTLRPRKPACLCEPMNLTTERHVDTRCPFYTECPGCWECEEWPMPPHEGPGDEDQVYVPKECEECGSVWYHDAKQCPECFWIPDPRDAAEALRGEHGDIDEAYTDEGARLVRINALKDDLSFDQLAELYLTLTDGIVRERVLRRTAEHKLYEVKKLLN